MQVLRDRHNGPLGGHFGRAKTGSLMRRLAFWVSQDCYAEYVRCASRSSAPRRRTARVGYCIPCRCRRGGVV